MQDSIHQIAAFIQDSHKIVILTGAGISTSCGIPDFRGTHGIYSYVDKKYHLPYPEAVFDIEYFRERPAPFFDFSKELFRKRPAPSFTHRFIAKLEKEEKLNLLVTQNIDMLHETAGNKKIIACHGTYQNAHCMCCGKKYSFSEYETDLKEGKILRCGCNGIIKPDIVFFGESLPASFLDFISSPSETDLMLVIGTSLTVQPANQLPLSIRSHYKVPMILINKDKTPLDNHFDFLIQEDIDDTFRQINSILKLLDEDSFS